MNLEEYEKRLRGRLKEGLYEIEYCGHFCLVGKDGYISWMVANKRIDDSVKLVNKKDKK